MNANPSFGVIQGDTKNGYNEILRECVLSYMRESEKNDGTRVFSGTLMLPAAYVGMGNVTQPVKAPLRCEE